MDFIEIEVLYDKLEQSWIHEFGKIENRRHIRQVSKLRMREGCWCNFTDKCDLTGQLRFEFLMDFYTN